MKYRNYNNLHYNKMVQSLYSLAENKILYSVVLSRKLKNVNANVRIVRAFDRAVKEGFRDDSDRMIDTLVSYITHNPKYVVEWTDIPILFMVGYINFRAVRLFHTSTFNIFGLLDLGSFIGTTFVSEVLLSESMCTRSRFYIALEQLSEVAPFEIVREILLTVSMRNSHFMITAGTSALTMVMTPELLTVIYSIALSQDPTSFMYIPDNFKKQSMCFTAVQGYAHALLDVPVHMMTEELCMHAVRSLPHAIEFVPNNFITYEMCDCAVSIIPVVIEYVPDHFRTLDLCVRAVFEDIATLKFVPAILHTSVRKSIFVILVEIVRRINRKYVLTNKIDIDSHIHTVAQNPGILRWLPSCGYLLASVIVEINWEAIAYIPLSLVTAQMCKCAFSQSPLALAFIPHEYQTDHMCIRAVEYSGVLIQNVAPHLLTKKLVYTSVRRNGIALKFIPERERTSSLCKLAVYGCQSALIYVPYSMRRQVKIGVAVVNVREGHYEYVLNLPRYMQTPDLWSNAVFARPRLIRYIPSNILSFEMCLHAVKHDVMLLEYVPVVFRRGSLMTYVYSRYLSCKDPLRLQRWLINQDLL